MARRARIAVWVGVLLGAVLVSSSAGQGPPPGAGPPGASPPGLAQAIAAKQRHADRLLDLPGVAGVAVALNPAGRAVVRIYKEQDDVEDLPGALDGVDVDTVTTGRLEPYDHLPTHRYPRPVPIGVSSGLAGVATGTLGVRVTDGTSTYALSNNHVYAGVNTASIGDPIISPGDADGGSDPGDRIGTLHAYQPIDFDGGTNTMDAAIALTSPDNVGTSTPSDGYGPPSSVTAAAFLGQPVQKYGRTTGLQLGSVAGTNVSVDVCYIALFDICLQEARFAGQVSVSPGTFAAPGDSGSLIVEQGSNQPVALLFAGGDGLTIGNPIDLVLQRFGVTIEGAPPGDGPPGAPTALTALAGSGSVSLSWSAPSFDGGSPVTGYKVYRGTVSGELSFLASSATTSYLDASAANGTTYYYRVSAENGNGESQLSNQASATPTSLVAPADPLAVVDDFDRPNESPLSDAGRWSNAINGGVETGLHVSSNMLACSVTSTCTAWRNATQYGPDAEVSTRISTLPGAGNAIRLYVRLQAPGTAGYDGYMLLASQASGTDQVTLYRITNSSLATLLTVSQELAAGDVLLLRASGTALEAWRHDGAWTRLGVVQDTAYAAAGYVGVGLRGTTGRLDDFGARTMGAPPPDTEPPSPPGTLTASAASTSQIDLSWGAASDNVAVVRYLIERCQGAGCTAFSQIATATATSFSDTGLASSTSYSYRVRAEDAVPLQGPYSNEASATTLAPPDIEPPSAPGTLTASAVSTSRIDLVWSAASDNVGVTLYRVERCQGAGCSTFVEIATTASTSLEDTALAASTAYSYRVRAEDAVPNLGPYGNTATATTLAPPDTEPPSAPGTLTASAVSTSRIDLVWSAASDNAGVTLYRIERCQGASCSDFVEIATTTTTSFDSDGLSASTSYSYRVRAEDAVLNLGPYGNTASATTPSTVVAPLEPLPTLDSFNRRNENPLSDAGRWSNGIAGSGETGLRVHSNALACGKTTTCTAWRNNATFGPDTEVWARLTTLPGSGNGLRLLARLQQPGTTTYSGYTLRTTQLSGTDQVALDRVDTGVITTRLTIAQELAAGDTLLLRVWGTTLEAWLKRGTTWTLLGSVTDATYAQAGRVGVGLRGKNGRLDDFGAR